MIRLIWAIARDSLGLREEDRDELPQLQGESSRSNSGVDTSLLGADCAVSLPRGFIVCSPHITTSSNATHPIYHGYAPGAPEYG